MTEDTVVEFIPRNYQVELMKIALKQNSIIFLPTGSGKTYIAVLVLKQMAESILRPYSKGGKITLMLVNAVPLVNQHAKNIRDHTVYTVGQLSGDMNVDNWPKERWLEEFDKYQVFIMTAQILVNLTITKNYLDLNKVNLLIFDECHKAVGDAPMRQIMKNAYGELHDPPRVVGLTATLLNGNCAPSKVMLKVRELETTFHSRVATVDELSDVIRYSTNPREEIVFFNRHTNTAIDETILMALSKLKELMIMVDIDECFKHTSLKPLKMKSYFKKISNCCNEIFDAMNTMGRYAGVKATLSLMIKFERIKRYCSIKPVVWNVLSHSITICQYVLDIMNNSFNHMSKRSQILEHSSDKLRQLFKIFDKFKVSSPVELCCIVFTRERYTAKVLNHVLKDLSKYLPEYGHIKPDFIVGYNANPYNDTREMLLINKKNRQVLERFKNKEINVLVASNVLEEGVDIPTCTLVIRYDKPMDYRSYVQSKGRARHKDSTFYILVEREEAIDYQTSYVEFNTVEQTLKDLLIGKNANRTAPTRCELQRMYNEDELPPFYVDGPGSAQINMQNAVALLCQYYQSLPSDIYTTYAPEWYVEETDEDKRRVVIYLPTICPILDVVEGAWMPTLKAAKEAAAYKACVMLYQAGALDNHLSPRRPAITDDEVKFLFAHYPEAKEPKAGTSMMKRLHKKQIPSCIRGQIEPQRTMYLHIINLTPRFTRCSSDINQSVLYDNYSSSLCYGFLTPGEVTQVCDFPVYVTLGQIDVNVEVNKRKVTLDEDQIRVIRRFHVTVFKDVLKILQRFLVFDNGPDAETAMLVPVQKPTSTIDFDVLRDHTDVREVVELTPTEKQLLQVTTDSHLGKIVSPWYRSNVSTYVVTEVCSDMNAYSSFPNEDYDDFIDYYMQKHQMLILNPEQHLLLVKGLTQRLTFVKPKGKPSKRRHEKMYEELTEYLIPELVVTQDFPAPLWIQANLLPTILSKILFCFQLEELRRKIAVESGLGDPQVTKSGVLELDKHLLDYEPVTEEEDDTLVKEVETAIVHQQDITPALVPYNSDYAAKKLEAMFPWKDTDEPTKDLERDLDVTLMDIECYEGFITAKVRDEDIITANESPVRKQKTLALTYCKDYVFKDINLLYVNSTEGPGLVELYKGLTTAKANDIVNLERLETLGDSFLKMITSVYLRMRYPKWNEGQMTELKGRIVSNKNLFYLARSKNITGVLRYHSLDNVKHDWLPPCFALPHEIEERIEQDEVSMNALFNLDYRQEGVQETGVLPRDKIKEIEEVNCPPDESEDHLYNSMASFLKCQYIGDKHVADSVESLLGTYFLSCGITGGMKFVQWMGIIPEDLTELINQPPENPFLNHTDEEENSISVHMPCWAKVESILGYEFRNKGYILEAFTHASFTSNRLTRSYERLEFLGDAVLDFLITCYIYEQCEDLTPGKLTDLRSALVNNNTFASLLVRLGLHKFMLYVNVKLQGYVDNFVEYMEQKNYQIDEYVLVLLDEEELLLAEQLDVPKALGDVFEALAGAVYLDSGRDLKTVWKVFHRIMWNELELFSQNVPKNAVKRLYEWQGAHPQFGDVILAQNGKCIVPLQFLLNGVPKLVHGCGTNKVMAKKAAAKLALRFLDM